MRKEVVIMGEPERKWYDGLLSLFSSRKFLLAVLGVVQTVVLGLIPDINPAIWQSIDALLVVLIGSIAHEDAAEKRANTPVG